MKDNERKIKKLSIWGFLLLSVAYLAVLKISGLLFKGQLHLTDGKVNTIHDVFFMYFLPIGLSALFVYALMAYLGWFKPVFKDDKPVQKWVWFVPITFIVAILLGINYPGLIDKGLGFTLLLLIGTQFVGWAEEGMFRGIGVTALRQKGLTEGKVALYSSAIFGLVHVSNAIGGNPSAFGQAIIVAFAGYFFYLIRRVSGSNVLNSVLHGLFDFMAITSTGIFVAGQKAYPGVAMALLVYIVVGIVLLVRRHKIELPQKA